MHVIREWRGKVYKVRDQDYDHNAWEILRAQVFNRDRYRCIRCDVRMISKLLTAHHIKPRSAGGPDSMANLLTLCLPCHNIVEIEGYHTRAEIIGSFEGDLTVDDEPEEEFPDEDKYDRPEWHKWVYGGVRRKPKR